MNNSKLCSSDAHYTHSQLKSTVTPNTSAQLEFVILDVANLVIMLLEREQHRF